EDEVERTVLPDLRTDGVLDLTEELRPQLHVPRLVHAVHVAERQRREVAALLPGAERADRRTRIVDGGVELLVDLVLDAVLFAAHDADLDLEEGVRLIRQLEQLLCDREV